MAVTVLPSFRLHFSFLRNNVIPTFSPLQSNYLCLWFYCVVSGRAVCQSRNEAESVTRVHPCNHLQAPKLVQSREFVHLSNTANLNTCFVISLSFCLLAQVCSYTLSFSNFSSCGIKGEALPSQKPFLSFTSDIKLSRNQLRNLQLLLLPPVLPPCPPRLRLCNTSLPSKNSLAPLQSALAPLP